MLYHRTGRLYTINLLHKVARIEAVPPYQQTHSWSRAQEEAAAGSGAERAKCAANQGGASAIQSQRVGGVCWGHRFEGNKHRENMQKPGKQQTDLAS